jgi:hypothetical protein
MTTTIFANRHGKAIQGRKEIVNVGDIHALSVGISRKQRIHVCVILNNYSPKGNIYQDDVKVNI